MTTTIDLFKWVSPTITEEVIDMRVYNKVAQEVANAMLDNCFGETNRVDKYVTDCYGFDMAVAVTFGAHQEAGEDQYRNCWFLDGEIDSIEVSDIICEDGRDYKMDETTLKALIEDLIY